MDEALIVYVWFDQAVSSKTGRLDDLGGCWEVASEEVLMYSKYLRKREMERKAVGDSGFIKAGGDSS